MPYFELVFSTGNPLDISQPGRAILPGSELIRGYTEDVWAILEKNGASESGWKAFVVNKDDLRFATIVGARRETEDWTAEMLVERAIKSGLPRVDTHMMSRSDHEVLVAKWEHFFNRHVVENAIKDRKVDALIRLFEGVQVGRTLLSDFHQIDEADEEFRKKFPFAGYFVVIGGEKVPMTPAEFSSTCLSLLAHRYAAVLAASSIVMEKVNTDLALSDIEMFLRWIHVVDTWLLRPEFDNEAVRAKIRMVEPDATFEVISLPALVS